MLTIKTPAPSSDLCTLGDLKPLLGITTTTEDTRLQRLIRRVSGELRTLCGQDFTRETVEETLPGTNSPRLYLSRTPLVKLTGTDGASTPITLGVSVDGTAMTDFTIDDDKQGTLYRAEGWPTVGERVARLSRDRVVGGAKASIVVTYVGGYILPTFPNLTPTLPPALEAAALSLAVLRYREQGARLGIKAESLGDWSATYQDDVLAEIRAYVAPFTRIHAC